MSKNSRDSAKNNDKKSEVSPEARRKQIIIGLVMGLVVGLVLSLIHI